MSQSMGLKGEMAALIEAGWILARLHFIDRVPAGVGPEVRVHHSGVSTANSASFVTVTIVMQEQVLFKHHVVPGPDCDVLRSALAAMAQTCRALLDIPVIVADEVMDS